MSSSQQVPDDHFAEELRGFGPIGIIAILLIIFTGNVILPNKVVIPIGTVLVLLWVRLSHTSWHEIGYVKPKNWLITITVGIISGIAFKFAMKAIIMPLFGADPVNQSYHFLAGNNTLLPAAIWAMLAAGFGEETVFRGYMFERFGKLLGTGITAKVLIVIITSILFGLSHYFNQGWPGVEQAIITGLFFGTIFSIKKSIWMVMIIHAAFDLTALAIIYWDIESDVAHLIFK